MFIPCWSAKLRKKGKTKAQLDEIIFWLTGYDAQVLSEALNDVRDFENFFAHALAKIPKRTLITGVVCGVGDEEIEDSTTRDIRYLDKLVNEQARRKKFENILRG